VQRGADPELFFARGGPGCAQFAPLARSRGFGVPPSSSIPPRTPPWRRPLLPTQFTETRFDLPHRSWIPRERSQDWLSTTRLDA
jgi:hypothetical protein